MLHDQFSFGYSLDIMKQFFFSVFVFVFRMMFLGDSTVFVVYNFSFQHHQHIPQCNVFAEAWL